VDQRERLGESEHLRLAMLTVQMRGEQKEMKQIKRRGTWKKKVGVGKLGELNTSSTLLMYVREQWRCAQSLSLSI
jgi:hypothetical protein